MDIHNDVPSAYTVELLPKHHYTFSILDNIFQII